MVYELFTPLLISFLKKRGKVWGIVGDNTYICTLFIGGDLKWLRISGEAVAENRRAF